jgi:alpha-tubulin suppressor-like RCC1 family protein
MKKKHTAHSGFLTLCISLGLLAFFAGLLVALSAIANPQSSTRENVRYADGHAHRAKGPPVVPTTGIFEAWVSPYNGQAQAIAVDASGNVYVTGTRSFGLGHEYATIRYDSAGQEQWVALYHGPANDDFARAIAIDSFGNVYVTGYSRRFAGGDFDYATIKYDAGGQEQWVARSNGSGYDYAYAMAIDAAGNVYVTGESNGSYATIKYNSAGQQQWVATYNGPGNGDDYAFAVALDELGNVYVTGQSVGTGTSWDYATIKYNASGQQQWVARYNGPANDIDVAQALALDDSGNVYVTGFRSGVCL